MTRSHSQGQAKACTPTSFSDRTIVTRLTPAGASALATIGIRGPKAFEIAERLFRRASGGPIDSDSRPYYGQFGEELTDDVVLRVISREPTAEVELHCHGGTAMVEALISQISQVGAERVGWTDYLRDQGLTGVQVEAAEALAVCPTARGAAILLDQYEGALDAALAEVSHDPDGGTRQRLLGFASLGLHLVHPWRVLLFGRTNVGKSCLLNALVGFERAIVSNQSGTTRDLLGAVTSLDGWPVELFDGAGSSEARRGVEAQGQQLLESRFGEFDLRVLVFDTSGPITSEEDRIRLMFEPDLLIGNKQDLPCAWNEAELAQLSLRCSAVTGKGVADLCQEIASRLVPEIPEPGAAVPFTERQVQWLTNRGS